MTVALLVENSRALSIPHASGNNDQRS